MINRVKEVINQTSVKTAVELIESSTFGNFVKITIIDGVKSTFMLNEEEFIDFYAQIELTQKKRVNNLIKRVNKK